MASSVVGKNVTRLEQKNIMSSISNQTAQIIYRGSLQGETPTLFRWIDPFQGFVDYNDAIEILMRMKFADLC
tara:strand:- start:224 stop:439 length:216 start_codon:yes stop_codon:yes gene_type:complete